MSISDRVSIRPAVRADAPAIAAAVQSSLAELSPWMPWATDDYDQASAEAWINGDFGDEYAYVITLDGQAVGSTGLNAVERLNHRANLGYWVSTDVAGQGVATAATRQIAQVAIEEAGLHRMEIMMSVHNHASRRVAENVGAAYEGIAVDRLLLAGEYHDAHMYAVIAGTWQPPAASSSM